ncbi:hypothetical protein B5C34_05490 [Pacificimonas flava]|uniref:Uncharacterized protein n=2 Tax=Pacificimonas TaxID=1960290 RepID=A0A219B4D1_9SPHN|nr:MULTISPECIES: hypothetical protein [Pacificimonas]MBZ6377326.1 hypothetical protein [Pacificimonas aurantium]OWV32966.1 hypothetical protein B5C34_05490 [Pacificimonas flava]
MTVISLDQYRRRRALRTGQVHAARAGQSALPSAVCELSAYAAGVDSLDAAVRRCVLGLLDAPSFQDMVDQVVLGWPEELGCTRTAVAIAAGDEAALFAKGGPSPLPARRVRAWAESCAAPQVRRTHGSVPVFGAAAATDDHAALVATVRLGVKDSGFAGLLAFGMEEAGPARSAVRTPDNALPDVLLGGTERLGFLGDALSRMIARWTTRSS